MKVGKLGFLCWIKVCDLVKLEVYYDILVVLFSLVTIEKSDLVSS